MTNEKRARGQDLRKSYGNNSERQWWDSRSSKSVETEMRGVRGQIQIGVGRARRLPLPPNRTGGSPASGCFPVGDSPQGGLNEALSFRHRVGAELLFQAFDVLLDGPRPVWIDRLLARITTFS